MSTNVLAQSRIEFGDHPEPEGWFEVPRSSTPRSARRRGDFRDRLRSAHSNPHGAVPGRGRGLVGQSQGGVGGGRWKTAPLGSRRETFSLRFRNIAWRGSRRGLLPLDLGPSLLVTHSCNLDKRRGSGEVHITRLQFLPLLDVAAEILERQAAVRRDTLNPPEVLYLGAMPGAWEAYVLLSEMYTLPAAMFAPRMETFAGDHRADPEDPTHLVLGRNADRLGRLSGDRIRILYDKMALFWMRMEFGTPDS